MSEGSVCIPNIGPRQRRQRILGGVIGLVLGVAASALLVALGVARPYRAAVFVPFFVGMVGFFQAREKTCVALVAKKARNMDLGDEAVSDESELQQLRTQAKKVYVQSLLSAALLSALVLLLP